MNDTTCHRTMKQLDYFLIALISPQFDSSYDNNDNKYLYSE